MIPAPSAERRGNSMLYCYEFDVGISYTDLMRETDVRLTTHRLNVDTERRYDIECRFTVSLRRRPSSYGTFWRQPKTLGHFGTLPSQSRTGEMQCIQHCHVGPRIAHCHCGPPCEARVVSWFAVEGDR